MNQEISSASAYICICAPCHSQRVWRELIRGITYCLFPLALSTQLERHHEMSQLACQRVRLASRSLQAC